MKQITVSGVDEALHGALSDEARSEGVSVNQYVLRLLRSALGLSPRRKKRPRAFTDLDHLAGTWSKDEGKDFLETLDRQRGIDSDMWE